MSPEQLEAIVDKKIDEKIAPLHEKLNEIARLLAKFEGAGTVMKFLFLGVAPLVAAFAWLKDHVRL